MAGYLTHAKTCCIGILSLALLTGSMASSNANPVPKTQFAVKQAITRSFAEGEKLGGGRMTEILVQLAWLADPVTFPFFLDARVVNHRVVVKGFVPAHAIRERACKIARQVSSLEILDEMIQYSNLMVPKTRVSLEELSEKVKTALHAAFPHTAALFVVHCKDGGRVTVQGKVKTWEDKLAVSQVVQRVNGCSGVTNYLVVTSAAIGQPTHLAKTKTGNTIQATSLPLPPVNKAPFINPNKTAPLPAAFQGQPTPTINVNKLQPVAPGNGTTTPNLSLGHVSASGPEKVTPISASASSNIGNIQEMSNVIPNLPKQVFSPLPAASPNLASQIKNKIDQTCGNQVSAHVRFISPTVIHIETHARSLAESESLAGKILSMPELLPYQVDLQIKIIP